MAAISSAAASSIARSSARAAASSAKWAASAPPATNAGAWRGASASDGRSGPSTYTTRSGSSPDDSTTSSAHTRPLSATRVTFEATPASSGLTYATFSAADTSQ